MKIVIISECTAREMLVVQRIVKHYPTTSIIQPTYSKKKRDLLSLAKRVWMKWQYSILKKRIFGQEPTPELPDRHPILASILNTQKGVSFIKNFSPDLLITCRAPILKKEILSIPSKTAVNVHYGIAPKYRGNDSLFWALYHNDFDHIGGCLHHITEGVDTGNILAEVYPKLTPKEDEISVGIKTSLLLADAIIDYIDTLETTGQAILGKKQSTKGKNYSFSDRTLTKSLFLALRNSFKNNGIPKRDAKIITYFQNDSEEIQG